MPSQVLFLTATTLCFVASLTMWSALWARRGHSYPGLGYWVVCVTLQCIGMLGFLLRSPTPSWLSYFLPNTLVAAAYLLLFRGLWRFRGGENRPRTDAALMAGFMVAFGLISLEPDWVAPRVVAFSLFTAGTSIAALVVTLRRRPPYFGATDLLLALWLTVLGLTSVVRVGYALLLGDSLSGSSVFSGAQTYFVLGQILMVPFIVVALISLHAQRAEHELRITKDRLEADIALRREVERELDRQHRTLEERVLARTAELRETNERLARTEFAMERVGIAVTWNDALTGRFLAVNDEACRQYGYRRDELMGMTVAAVNPGFDTRALASLTAQLRSSDDHARIETEHRRRDGSTYPAEVTVWLDRGAEPEQLIAFVSDISARKAAESELIHARDRAEAASRAKSTFLANMSHELRTPLNGIIGLSELLARRNEDPRQQAQLDKIRKASRHLLEIISDILDLSRIEADRLELHPAPFTVDALLDTVASVVAPRAQAAGLGWTVELAPSLGHLRLLGDATRLGQILINLAGNAVKFTHQGQVTVRAAAQDDGPTGRRLRFEVEDTGIGIPAEHLARLFSAFEQGDGSLTRRYGGSGLGLAISRRLAELMGGDIGVDSRPGEGSRFWFTVRLPLAAGADAGGGSAAAQPAGGD